MVKISKTNGSEKQFGDEKSWGRYGESLYKYWVDTYSHNHVKKWLKKRKYDMNSCNTQEFIDYMTEGFINWINRSK